MAPDSSKRAFSLRFLTVLARQPVLYLILGLSLLAALAVYLAWSRITPYVIDEIVGVSTIHLVAVPRAVVLPEECVSVQWNVEHIQAIYLDGSGKAGVGSEIRCIRSETTLTFNIAFPDGHEQEYRLPVGIEYLNRWPWLVLAASGLLLLMAGHFACVRWLSSWRDVALTYVVFSMIIAGLVVLYLPLRSAMASGGRSLILVVGLAVALGAGAFKFIIPFLKALTSQWSSSFSPISTDNLTFVQLFNSWRKLRADFRRTPPTKLITPNYWTAFVFLLIITGRIIFVVTYPLNNLGGDTSNYFDMLTRGKSSLVHAGGYPFLFGLPLQNPMSQRLISDHQQAFTYLLLLAQHAIDVAIIAIMFVVLYSIYSRWAAVLAALTYGLSFFSMSWTSYVYPEWLQGGLLVLSFCAAYFALRAARPRRKMVLYSLTGAFFTWSVLVKFNSMLMAPLFLAVFVAETSAFKKRVLYALIAGAFGLASVLVFLLLYHYPTTGTFELTMDRAWLLMSKLEMGSVRLSIENGINSKRWLALSGVLPNNYLIMAGPGLFSHIDAVPPEVRSPYREKYLYLFEADETTLDAVIRDHPLPKDFDLGYSSLPIAYYIGLEEAERLGTKVFLEAIWANRSTVIADMLKKSISGLSDLGRETMPTWQNMSGLRQVETLPNGFARFELVRGDYYNFHYWSKRPILWAPGVSLFSLLSGVSITPIIPLALGILATLSAVMTLVVERRLTMQRIIPVLLFLQLVLFVLGSNFLYLFRDKEYRFTLPLFCILLAVGLARAVPDMYYQGLALAGWFYGQVSRSHAGRGRSESR
jgi:hypothetical protein